jgi:hypothetical protein
MLLTYKIMSDRDTAFIAQWFEKADTRRPTRNNSGHSNLIPGRASHSYRQEFFSLREPNVWSVLPNSVKEAATAAAFKTRYRQHIDDRVVRR